MGFFDIDTYLSSWEPFIREHSKSSSQLYPSHLPGPGSYQLSGAIPPDIGKILASNRLSGNLPLELSELRNLTDFRINDNNFNGTITDFIQNWKQLERLEMYASGLQGPIPSSISALVNLKQLRINHINGISQVFPDLGNVTGLIQMNCNLYGKMPAYIWRMNSLQMLFLTGNTLSGDIPESILMKGSDIDLSYNNFTWQIPDQPAFQWKIYTNLNLNLFRSSFRDNFARLRQCRDDFKCSGYWNSLYVNCGGDDVKISGNMYEGDAGVDGGAAEDYFTGDLYWGFSCTGDFMDDNDVENAQHTINLLSQNISEL